MGRAAWETDGPGRQRLGRYEILARLGAGGMAAVYKARDADSGRVVALKVLPPDLASRPNWLKRFSREALTSARLNHPNLVDVFELNEANGVHYIAMEYVDGLNLEAYLAAKGKLPPDEAVDIAAQAARALEHARQHGIVHRDVKPSNLLLTQVDGRRLVKLADLGLDRWTPAATFIPSDAPFTTCSPVLPRSDRHPLPKSFTGRSMSCRPIPAKPIRKYPMSCCISWASCCKSALRIATRRRRSY
jgi:serine/threonine protein kinase